MPKLMRWGGRHNTSYGIIIPKEVVTKYKLNEETFLMLEDDEDNKRLVIKKIPYE